jgi:hypothetical protein
MGNGSGLLSAILSINWASGKPLIGMGKSLGNIVTSSDFLSSVCVITEKNKERNLVSGRRAIFTSRTVMTIVYPYLTSSGSCKNMDGLRLFARSETLWA